MRCLRGGRKGAESAAGGSEEMGWQLGWKGKGEGGVGQDGEWRDKGAEGGERNANETRVPASCGGGEGSGVRRARRFSPPVGLEIDDRHRPSLPVGEVRTGRDFLDYPSDLYKSIHKSHQL